MNDSNVFTLESSPYLALDEMASFIGGYYGSLIIFEQVRDISPFAGDIGRAGPNLPRQFPTEWY